MSVMPGSRLVLKGGWEPDVFRGWRRCGTQTVAAANCVPVIVHFPFGVEDVWHTIFVSGDLCATDFSFFSVD